MRTRTLAIPSAFLDHCRRQAPIARLYMTVAECDFLEGTLLVDVLPARQLFHGEPAGFLVRRLPSDGGGYCAATDCVEVV